MSADIWVSVLLVGVPILAAINFVGLLVLGVLQYRQSRLVTACFRRLNDAFIALHDVNVKIGEFEAVWPAEVIREKVRLPAGPIWKDLRKETDGVDAFPPQRTQPMKDNVPPLKGGE